MDRIKTRAESQKEREFIVNQIITIVGKNSHAQLVEFLGKYKDKIDADLASEIVMQMPKKFSASSTWFGENRESFLMLAMDAPLSNNAIQSIVYAIESRENNTQRIISYKDAKGDDAVTRAAIRLADILSKSENIINLADAVGYGNYIALRRTVSEQDRETNFKALVRTREYAVAKEAADLFSFLLKSLPEETRQKDSKIFAEITKNLHRKVIEIVAKNLGKIDATKSGAITDVVMQLVENSKVKTQPSRAEIAREQEAFESLFFEQDEGAAADEHEEQFRRLFAGGAAAASADAGLDEDFDDKYDGEEFEGRYGMTTRASYLDADEERISQINKKWQADQDSLPSSKLTSAAAKTQASLTRLESKMAMAATPRNPQQTTPQTPSSSETKGAGSALSRFSFESPQPTSPTTRSMAAAAAASSKSSSKSLFASPPTKAESMRSGEYGRRNAEGENSPPKKGIASPPKSTQTLQHPKTSSAAASAARASSPERDAGSKSDSEDEVVYV